MEPVTTNLSFYLLCCSLAYLLTRLLVRSIDSDYPVRKGIIIYRDAIYIFFVLSFSWPNSGCCGWDDSHSYELKHRMRTSGRVFIPRGILLHRIPCPVFSVMDVFSAQWRPLVPAGINKMVVLLFWTKWYVLRVILCLF